MRVLLSLLLFLGPLSLVAGCGGGRPDPRANPDFDHAAFENVDDPGAMQALSEDAKMMQ
jgi:hypothetical protein